MATEQIVIITILCVIGVIVFCEWIYRLAEIYDDNLWIEPLILAVLGMFIYLVAR